MGTERDIAKFIDAMRKFLDQLAGIKASGASRDEKERDFELLVESLQSAVEELQVTQEELLEQSAALEESRRIAEEQHQRYRDLFEFAPDGYIVSNSSGVIQEANQNAARMLNASARFLQNKPMIVFVAEEDRSRFLTLLGDFRKANAPQEWEIRLQPAGEMPAFDAAITLAPKGFSAGAPTGLHWLIRDITERKRVETALRREKDRAQRYLDIAGTIIVSIGSDERVELINQRGCELLGYPSEEIIGKRWFDEFVPEDIREETRRGFHELLRGIEKGWLNYENPVVTWSGVERIIDWRNIPLRDEHGRITGTLSSGEDVTERRRAEERLRRQKEFADHLIDSSGDGIIAFDMDFRCTVWNAAMERISGIPRGETVGKNIFEKFPFLREGQEQYQAFLDTVGGKTIISKECPFVVPSTGRLAYFDSEFSPLRDEKGNIIGGLAIIRDVTERKLSEETIRESEARYRRLSENLEEAVQAKVAELQQAQSLAAIGQVVSIVAHEVRNPLQNIHMGMELLRQLLEQGQDVNWEKLNILGDMDYGMNQLDTIVADLLEYSKPVKLNYSLWQFRDLIERVITALSEKLQHINTQLKLEDDDKPIFGDPDKIGRVLLNLITNAAEAMPGGGTLVISSGISRSVKGKMFRISIKDTGVGIDEETIRRVHEPFFTTKPQGTGLGLSICKKIVDAHGGEMRLTSKVHEGTTVEILLPLDDRREERKS
jgi:PAS domain S-box-containing protein